MSSLSLFCYMWICFTRFFFSFHSRTPLQTMPTIRSNNEIEYNSVLSCMSPYGVHFFLLLAVTVVAFVIAVIAVSWRRHIFFLLICAQAHTAIAALKGRKSNWGENLACCASEYSIDIVYAKAVSLHHPHPYPFPLASNCPHIFIRSRMQTHIRGVRSTKCEIQNIRDGIDRRMCTLHWCASLLKPIMNFKCTQHLLRIYSAQIMFSIPFLTHFTWMPSFFRERSYTLFLPTQTL